MTTQDLKNRKNYIVAKITKEAGSENVKSYMNLMLWIVENDNFEGTVYELFLQVHSQLRERSRKTTKVAEARARVAEATGIEQKSWDEIKFNG
jgi:hypothetical protein